MIGEQLARRCKIARMDSSKESKLVQFDMYLISHTKKLIIVRSIRAFKLSPERLILHRFADLLIDIPGNIARSWTCTIQHREQSYLSRRIDQLIFLVCWTHGRDYTTADKSQ